MIRPLPIDEIVLCDEVQSRRSIDWIVVDEYAKAMESGDVFPPVVVFSDGTTYWLADGFHRIRAAKNDLNQRTMFDADVREGSRRDAEWFAFGANKTHGKRLETEDRDHILKKIFGDEKWKAKGIREIARHTGIALTTVHRYEKLSVPLEQIKPSTRIVTRNGTTYTMDTSDIGRSEPPADPDLFKDLGAGVTIHATSIFNGSQSVPDPIALPIAILNKDSRVLADYASDVHLVITSPPYNVDIEYDQHNDNLSTYLEMLTDIWTECYAAMVDGGRICVNVLFGAGRNPWVPMMPTILNTLVEAGFTIRGQIIWDKGTAGGKTSWGSFRLPTDPGLRDTTECVIIAHKNQSHLEIPDRCRLKDDKGSHTAWLADSDYFMSLAQDHWVIAPESATRIGHPAPFPKELVRRLIHFYGFPGCHVVDPFGGSGTVGVVAKELGCQATLFEISQQYSELAGERIRG